MTPATATASFFDDSLYTDVAHLTEHTPSPLNTFMVVWTDWGLGLFAILMIWAWLRARTAGRPQLPGLAVPLIVVVAFLVNDVVKSLFHEVRPCQALSVVPLQPCPAVGDWSFPSNHVAIAAAATAALWLVDRKMAAIALPAMLLIAVSRVWVGAHYPHDVLAGLLVGAVVGAALECIVLGVVRSRRAGAPAEPETLLL
ncbi:phosphatase PAP2 family protein [Streptomyces sp. HUAS MG91]|uniref:Phosphatase PAP2 family protein n=1 Tax=Streptomyces tabacisoli TaxID=3156398 RepID=A0AAU8IJV5_9ACTN